MPSYASAESASSTEDAARDWLSRMSHSSRELNYQGVFTYERGTQMTSLQIYHAVKDGVEKERLVYLTGAPREVIREGHELTCVHPGNAVIQLEQSNPTGVFAGKLNDAKNQFDRFYQLGLGGEERIANRQVVKIVVNPRDDYRYGHALFLDKETGLLIKSVIVDVKGRPLERFQFANIVIGKDIADEDLQAQIEGYRVAHHPAHGASGAASAPAAGYKKWRVNWIPQGYVKTQQKKIDADGQKATKVLDSTLFTDGLSAFSVFLEALKSDSAVEGAVQRGATVAFTRHMLMNGKVHVVTVVGEVPMMTAEKVASSVRLLK